MSVRWAQELHIKLHFCISNLQWDVHFKSHFFLPDEATAIGDLLKKPVQLGDDGFGDSAGFTYYILQYIYIYSMALPKKDIIVID